MSCDRISQLPDALLTEILSYLSTKESVMTSTLSKRWKPLWRLVPVLDLVFSDDPQGEASDIFVDKFLNFREESGTEIQKFKIMFDDEENYLEQIEGWIGTTVNRGVQHLEVICSENYEPDNVRYMPQNIFTSDRLGFLKLVSVGIKTPKFGVSLPCLKFMYLNDIWCDDSLIMEKLISGSPVLEDLTLVKLYGQAGLLVLRVRSQTLKRFSFWFENNMSSTEFSVEIDAPQLEHLSFNDNQSDMIVVKNLSSLSMVDINSRFHVSRDSTLDLRKKNTIHAFLSGISSARDMLISERTLEILYEYSELGQIPKFNNLYILEAELSDSVLEFLPVFLESCPNLRKLVLDFSVSKVIEQVELSNVPVCLSSTLECVEMKYVNMEKETWIEVVNYFLENSAVLEKLSVRFRASPVIHQELDSYKNLLTSTKLSRKCQVVFVH